MGYGKAWALWLVVPGVEIGLGTTSTQQQSTAVGEGVNVTEEVAIYNYIEGSVYVYIFSTIIEAACT